MPSTITFLHLSDRHTNRPDTGWDANRVIRTLVEDLRRLQSDHGLVPDFLLFTGDLAWGQMGDSGGKSLAEQFREGDVFLDAVRNAFSPPISRENTFIVPGNHDINRDSVGEQDTLWLDEQRDPDVITRLIKENKKTGWKRYVERLTEYRQFLEEAKYTHLLEDPDRLTYAVERSAGGRKIGFAGFNSAWSCCRASEKSKLWIGGHWQAETLRDKLHSSDFAVALVHHPNGWYRDEENSQFWRHRIQERFNMSLHGHEHDAWVTEVNGHVGIAAGAVYQWSNAKMGYSIIRLFPDEGRGEAWLRTYDDRGKGGWRPDVIPDKTNNQGVWPLEDLDWLRPPDPPDSNGSSGPEAPTGPVPNGVATLRSKLDQIGNLASTLLGADLQSILEQGGSETAVMSQRIVRQNNQTTIHQTFILNVMASAPSSIASSSSDGASAASINRELEEIAKLIERHQIVDAEARLDKMVADTVTPLTDRDHFRILVRRGHIAHARRQDKHAAGLYRQAIAHIPPVDKYARYFKSLADELDGLSSAAHDEADKLRSESPEFESAAVLAQWIRTAPIGLKTVEIENRLKPDELKHPEVQYTLARRAADQGDFDAAVRLIRSLLAARPDWIEVRTTLAAVLMEQRFGKTVRAGHSHPPDLQWPEFSEVRSLLAGAIREIGHGQAAVYAAALHLNLGLAYTISGRYEDAASEFTEACKLSPADPEAVKRYAYVVSRTGRLDDAVNSLRTWLLRHDSPEIRLLLAQFLCVSVPDSAQALANRQEAAKLLEEVKIGSDGLATPVKAEVLAILIQVYCDLQRVHAAQDVLNEAKDELFSPALRLLLQAGIEQTAGRADQAIGHARSAADVVDDNTDRHTIAQLALLFEELQDFSRAAQLWERLATFVAVGTEEEHFLVCSQRANSWEAVIRGCRRLRSKGVLHHRLIDAEIGALERVSKERLVETLREFLRLPLEDSLRRRIVAQLSYVSIFMDRSDLFESDSSKLPQVNELEDARFGVIVVDVLRHCPDPFLAVTYAYALFRRFPDDAYSHIAMIHALLSPDREHVTLPDPTRVEPGAAVRYRLEGSSDDIWCVIEDGPSPSPTRMEYSLDHPVVRAVIGKGVGEKFNLPNSPFGRQEAIVVQIQSKYVYRLQEIIENFQSRFADHRVIWKSPPNQQGIDGILRHVEERQKQLEEIYRIYRDNAVTFQLLAEALGECIFDVVQHVAGEPSLSILCIQGSSQEEKAGKFVAANGNSFVVDSTALATLYILQRAKVIDARDLLHTINVPLFISEHVLADARQSLLRMPTRDRLSIAKVGSQFVRHTVSAKDASEERSRLREFLRVVQAVCKVVPAEQPKESDRAWYEQLVQTIGLGGAESVRISRYSQSALWTDELFSAQYCQLYGSAKRVWTRAILQMLQAQNLIRKGTAEAGAIVFYQCGYRFIGLSADVLHLAAVRAGWRTSNAPLRELLTQYSDPNVSGHTAVRSAAAFLSIVWREIGREKKPKRAKGITRRMLELLLKRPDGMILIVQVELVVSGRIESDPELLRQWQRTVRNWMRRRPLGW